MRLSGNTILITGGGSGIGRGMAEEFHRRGNKVIVSGRREAALAEVAAANPGIETMTLDIADAADVERFGAEIVQRFPELDAVVHMAGIMQNEKLTVPGSMLGAAEATVATNLLGPMRLTAALLPQLLSRPRAALLTVTSGIAYLPFAMTPAYTATKFAIRGWTDAVRIQLRDTHVQVIEIIPPYVRTGLMGDRQASDANAMPLDKYLADTFAILENQPDETQVVIEGVTPQRYAEARGEYKELVVKRNEMLMAARKAEWDALG
ncbi:SDR family oxidoreductase [Aureimonas leprariae]|uniref:SDR family NAD(P)-dependent oxidoreductase n=1 Tax=Plantimonas leprariae TaxID=2615207 RepID=A0A7V7TVJ5_9HYPH|nr:SDR family NAD(P)-dependent oxidoreductase [Aureimonas leprariae]KAB0677996.1 SDR family NAD(P)-dependent oxidoreductase [Aureimonas leprariae]